MYIKGKKKLKSADGFESSSGLYGLGVKRSWVRIPIWLILMVMKVTKVIDTESAYIS
jgi:putative exporter of polyketide antibiotics